MKRLETVEDVEQFLEQHKESEAFIFKRSTRCPVSAQAFEEFKRFAAKHSSVPVAYVDVIESRPVSNHIAEKSEVEHKSPQVIHYHKGDVVWNDSHHAIKEEALEKQKKS